MVEIKNLWFYLIVDRIFPCPKLFPGSQIQNKEISSTNEFGTIPSFSLFWMSIEIQNDKILVKNNFFRISMCAEFMTPGFRQERPRKTCIYSASIKFANLKILPLRYYNYFKTWYCTVKMVPKSTKTDSNWVFKSWNETLENLTTGQWPGWNLPIVFEALKCGNGICQPAQSDFRRDFRESYEWVCMHFFQVQFEF